MIRFTRLPDKTPARRRSVPATTDVFPAKERLAFKKIAFRKLLYPRRFHSDALLYDLSQTGKTVVF